MQRGTLPPRYLSLRIEERFVEKKAQNNGSGRAAMTCFSASFRIKESKMWKRSVPKSEIEEVGVGRIESM